MVYSVFIRRRVVPTAIAAVAASGLGQAGVSYAAASPAPAPHISLPQGFSAHVIASAPAGASGPDDIVRLGDHLFIGYQNGVGSKGEPAPAGNTDSTLVEYTLTGKQVASWKLTGKIDGLGADPDHQRVVATVNEDGNSSLYTVTDGGRVTHYTYGPKPLPHGGGTDSVVAHDGALYISASAPAADPNGKTYSKPALLRVTLSGSQATWEPVFADNAAATDAVTGKTTTLNLSDPDSSENVPGSVRPFAGDLLLDSQGDKQLLFLKGLAGSARANAQATVLNLPTQVDDTAFAPQAGTTLYVVDSGSGNLYAISGPFAAGQAFVSVPKDSDSLVKTLGLLNLKTGAITPFGTGFGNPKGLLFAPAPITSPPSATPSAATAAQGGPTVIPQGGVETGGGGTAGGPGLAWISAGAAIALIGVAVPVVVIRRRRADARV